MRAALLTAGAGVLALLCCAGWDGALAGVGLAVAVVGLGAGVASWFSG